MDMLEPAIALAFGGVIVVELVVLAVLTVSYRREKRRLAAVIRQRPTIWNLPREQEQGDD